MSEWVAVKEAVEAAKDMITTVVVTLIYAKKDPATLVVQVHGVEQMYQLIQTLDRMKSAKKIQKYQTNNLTVIPAMLVEDFVKFAAKKK